MTITVKKRIVHFRLPTGETAKIPTYTSGELTMQRANMFLFFPGWACGTSDEYRPFIEQLLREHGSGTVYVLEFNDHSPQFQPTTLQEHFSPELNLHPTQEQKAFLGRSIFKLLYDHAANTNTNLTVVAYSEGAIHAVLNLDHQIRKVLRSKLRNTKLILLNPAGLAPPVWLPETLARAARNKWQKMEHFRTGTEEARATLLAHDSSMQYYLRTYPGAGRLGDGCNSGGVDVRAAAATVAHNLPVQVVTCLDDAMINLGALAKFAQEEDLAGILQWKVVHGDHFLIFTNPSALLSKVLL